MIPSGTPATAAKLLTVGQIAAQLGLALHVVEHVLDPKTGHGIEPVQRGGQYRLYAPAQIPAIQAALARGCRPGPKPHTTVA